MKLDRFHTLVFAGGGNRCWWQAGFLSGLTEQRIGLPGHLIGTSAGAAIAAAHLANGVSEALHSCVALYRQNKAVFRWKSLGRLQVEFAHRHIYPSWIRSFIAQPAFEVIKSAEHRLTVAVTHPNRLLGVSASVALGTAAYLIDKNVWHSIHPRIPKYFGLRQGFYSLNECATLDDGRALLCASAAAPPLMPPIKIGGRWSFDGGYIDNAPIVQQTESEKAATLVLLTRHYPRRSVIFRHDARTYLQPSRPVPVSTWDCTTKATVMDAFHLGYNDAFEYMKHACFCRPS